MGAHVPRLGDTGLHPACGGFDSHGFHQIKAKVPLEKNEVKDLKFELNEGANNWCNRVVLGHPRSPPMVGMYKRHKNIEWVKTKCNSS